MPDLTHASLFTGIGGLDLAAEWAGFQTVAQCEWADYATKVLEKHWPDTPRWRDIRTLTGDDFRAQTGIKGPTVISGGFPCQPHSLSGHRLASNDERDLWDEFARIIREVNPKWVVAENVPGLLSSENGQYFGRILRDLAQMGRDVWWGVFPAHAAGAPFWGERVAIVAAPAGQRRSSMDESIEAQRAEFNLEVLEQKEAGQGDIPFHVEWPVPEPIGEYNRNDDGLSVGVDRLKCLGNAVVPQQFYPIFEAIAGIENGIIT